MSSPAPSQLSFGQTLGALGVQAGLGIISNKIAQRPQNQMNEWQRLQYENELRRRNAMQGIGMPSLIRGLGYTEDHANQMANQFQSQQDAQQQGQVQPSGQSSSGGSKLSTATNLAGLGATGLGIASKLGAFGAGAAHAAPAISGSAAAANAAASGGVTLGSGGMPAAGGIAGHLGLGGGSGLLGMGSATIPVIGGIVGAGLLAKHFVGEGRRAANDFVQSVQNPFGQQLQQISQMIGTNPAQAKQMLMQAESTYRQQAQAAIAQGGNQAKVAQQSLNDQGLQGTVQRLKQQLGIQ